jgi:alpha-tubulin suppressor-like RCC1 family protein
VAALNEATAISVGQAFACALIADGTVMCWGSGEAGELGDGSTESESYPAADGLSGVAAISTGNESACALLSSGTVECWGFNEYAELGDGTTTNSSVPVPVVW